MTSTEIYLNYLAYRAGFARTMFVHYAFRPVPYARFLEMMQLAKGG